MSNMSEVELYETVLDSAPNLIIASDRQGKIQFVNRATFGMPVAEMIGRSALDFVDEEFRERLKKTMENAALERVPGELVISDKSEDDIQWFRLRVGPIIKDNNVEGFVFVSNLITNQILAEEKLRDSEAKLRSIFNMSPEGITLTNEEGRIIEWNQAQTDIFGISKEQAVGRFAWDVQSEVTAEEMVPEETRGKTEGSLRQFFATGSAPWLYNVIEAKYKRHDGPGTILQLGIPIKTSDGFLLCSFVQDITARRRAEQERERLERRYRALFDQSNDAVFIIGLDGKHIDANSRAAELLGYSRNELLDLSYTDTVTEDELAESRRRFDAVLKGSEQPIYERTMIKKDGSRIPVEMNVSLVEDENGSPLHVQNIVRDISLRKASEDELINSEKKYRELTENSLEGIQILQNNRVVFVNTACAEIVGRSKEELYSLELEQLWDIVYPVDREQIQKKHWKQRTTGELEDTSQYRIMRPDGSLRWLEARESTTEYDGQPAIQRTLIDVTERMVAQEAVKAERDKAELYLDTAGVCLVALDLDAKVTLVNRRAMEVLGYPQEELVGRPWSDFIPQQDQDDFKTAFDALVSGAREKLEYTEGNVSTRSGDERLIAWYAACLKDASGSPMGVIASGEDITEKRAAQKELKESQAMLSLVMETIPQLIFWKDRQSMYLGCNANFARAAGFERNEDIIGKTDFDLPWRADEAQGYREADRKILEEGLSLYDQIESMRRADGVDAWFRTIKAPLLDANGEIIGILGTLEDVTEKKKAQLELEQAQTIINMSPAVAFLWKNLQEWPVEYVSKNIFDLLGYSAEEFMTGSITYAQVIHRNDLTRVMNEVEGFSADSLCESFTHEPYRVVTKSGEVRWVSDNTVINRNEKGEITHYQGVVSDITDRHNALETLERERASFRSIAEAAVHALNTTDLAKRILEGLLEAMNLEIGTLRLFDEKNSVLKPTASIGLPQDLAERIAPCTAEGAKEFLTSRVAMTGEIIYSADRETDPNSWDFDDLVRVAGIRSLLVSPLKNEKGEILGTLLAGSRLPNMVSTRDSVFFETMSEMLATVLERRRTEQAYQMSVRRYRNLLTEMSEGIGIVDLDENFVFVNESFSKLLGFNSDELIGTDSRNLIHPDDLPRLKMETHLRMEGVSSSYQLRMIRKDGDERVVRISAIPSRDDDGHVEGAVAIMTDMTERVRAEREVRQLNEELAQRVEDRTAELAAANRELEAFAYSVSHDLRAPLRIIDGFSQAILEDYADALDDTGKDYLTRIRAGAVNMAKLIEDILSLSRVTRAEMERVDVNLSTLAQEVVSDLVEAEPDRKVTTDIQKDLIARCDKRLMRVVLQNLIGNSWKYTKNVEDAKIEFGHAILNSESVFFVKDNGAGFDMEYSDKLFKPFQRLHKADEFEGSGIGLATVMRIITRHGGRIWAEAEKDSGATFFFTLEATSGDESH